MYGDVTMVKFIGVCKLPATLILSSQIILGSCALAANVLEPDQIPETVDKIDNKNSRSYLSFDFNDAGLDSLEFIDTCDIHHERRASLSKSHSLGSFSWHSLNFAPLEIQEGVDYTKLNTEDEEKLPLHYAIKKEMTTSDFVSILNYTPDQIYQSDHLGRTPADFAAFCGRKDILEEIMKVSMTTEATGNKKLFNFGHVAKMMRIANEKAMVAPSKKTENYDSDSTQEELVNICTFSNQIANKGTPIKPDTYRINTHKQNDEYFGKTWNNQIIKRPSTPHPLINDSYKLCSEDGQIQAPPRIDPDYEQQANRKRQRECYDYDSYNPYIEKNNYNKEQRYYERVDHKAYYHRDHVYYPNPNHYYYDKHDNYKDPRAYYPEEETSQQKLPRKEDTYDQPHYRKYAHYTSHHKYYYR